LRPYACYGSHSHNTDIYRSDRTNFGYNLAIFTVYYARTDYQRSFLVQEQDALNLQSIRAKKARLATKVDNRGDKLLLVMVFVFAVLSLLLFLTSFSRIAYLTAALTIVIVMFSIWYRQDLSILKPTDDSLDGRLGKEVLGKLKAGYINPQSVWVSLNSNWQSQFFTNRLLFPLPIIEQNLSADNADMALVWDKAKQLVGTRTNPTIEVGHVVAALLLTSLRLKALFTQLKVSEEDIEAILGWVMRLVDNLDAPKSNFGGIGRDWTTGFTPHLSQFGQNLSISAEKSGDHFDWLQQTQGVIAVKNALAQGSSGVALIGPPGIGKSSYIAALSGALLAETEDKNLMHQQIVSLSPSMILSSAKGTAELEHVLVTIMNEASHAGHIILFFDDAQLFFHEGLGSFDITQVLLPILEDSNLQLIFAMSPNDFQSLKSNQSAFAAKLTPVVLAEPDEKSVMKVLEDTTLGLEYRHGVLISYGALHETYRLSGRFEQEMAYPGKAIRLLEESLPYANNGILTAESIQQAIEKTRGIKTGSAAPVEADELLNLEDEIHERMINQSRAVNVVSSALRRARAGVANPKRPIGSFLFLGPTGVGKTELAKSIAATYFKGESNLIRLDMSEYQQADDVKRLLASANDTSGLITSIRERPFSVVLLDEIEKAHPNVLNLLLQLLDEGQLTDIGGRVASFKDCIIIVTSNAGAQEIREHIANGEELETFESSFIDQLVSSNQFKPELLNRFDEIVLFRPLNQIELAQVVGLMMREVNQTLSNQKIIIELTDTAIQKIVEAGYDARLGARPMRRVLQHAVEDTVANQILSGQIKPGDRVRMDEPDLNFN
jgi:ATP-dependent Clp protease ATP-binding subunit ClpC